MAPIFTGSKFGFGRGAAAGGSAFSVTTTGGTPFTPGDGYEYFAFPAPGSFTVSGTGDIEYFVLAGGGSGGSAYGGGGGAGGFRVGTIPNATGPYPLTVGPGATFPNSGGPSYIGPAGEKVVQSDGGGQGSTPGGSGGGSNYAGVEGAGNLPIVASPVQGYPGGDDQPANGTGGGGGAGGIGGDARALGGSYGSGGNGGVGRVVPGWNIPPSYGTPGATPGRWFGGGGGGGSINVASNYGGNGGDGGGGQGGGGPASATPRAAGNGLANTGGGGGGRSTGVGNAGGDGGSGIIMIRYLV